MYYRCNDSRQRNYWHVKVIVIHSCECSCINESSGKNYAKTRPIVI